MEFLRRNASLLILLLAALVLTGTILANTTQQVEDKASQIEANQANIARNSGYIEKNCELLAKTNDAVREQFRLAMTDDIQRVQAFIDSGGAATPAAKAELQRSVDENVERRQGLASDFPNLICP